MPSAVRRQIIGGGASINKGRRRRGAAGARLYYIYGSMFLKKLMPYARLSNGALEVWRM